jgi:hypothetical protein
MVERRIDKATKAAKGIRSTLREAEVFQGLLEHLNQGKSARSYECSEEDAGIIATAELLSLKRSSMRPTWTRTVLRLSEERLLSEGGRRLPAGGRPGHPVCAKLRPRSPNFPTRTSWPF